MKAKIVSFKRLVLSLHLQTSLGPLSFQVIFMVVRLILGITIFLFTNLVVALDERSAARGHIKRLIANHKGVETFITTDDINPACAAIKLKLDNPNVTEASFDQLFSYLLAAKLADRKVELFTGASDCLLFRVEIID